MVELTNGRGVTLRTAWVDDNEPRENKTRKGHEESSSPSCPSCGAPLRRTHEGKMYCWFCERDFDLDTSGSVIDSDIRKDEDDFEMDLEDEGKREEDPLPEEELDFDLEIDIEVQDDGDHDEWSEDVEKEEEEVQWDEEEGSDDIEFSEEEFEIEEDDPEEPIIQEKVRTMRKRKVHIRSDDVEFEE